MNNSLAQLKDLKLPSAPSIWPLAYGWYLVTFAIVCLIAFAFWAYFRRRQRLKPIKKALSDLEKIYLDYQQHQVCADAANQLLVLIKRFLFCYHPRKAVAPLYGEKLCQLLGAPAWGETLIAISYQKAPKEDMEPLFNAIKQWIKEGKHATL